VQIPIGRTLKETMTFYRLCKGSVN
jgi:hypothetical protein